MRDMDKARALFSCLSCLLFFSCNEIPAAANDTDAPFFGPSTHAPEKAETASLQAIPKAATSGPAQIPDEAAARHGIWTESRFRCRAISTTRLRTCRFEQTAMGWSITFPIADLTCDDVVFDAAGDPSELRSCRSKWLRVPSTAALKRDRTGDMWSGSHAGWRWPNDGETYCCPGVWIEAPAALRGG
jgi:hypothetical protein